MEQRVKSIEFRAIYLLCLRALSSHSLDSLLGYPRDE